MSVCACGHVERLHAPGCTACPCHGHSPAADPDAAREHARQRAVERARLVAQLRTATARQTWDACLGAVLALQQLDRDPKGATR